MSMLLSRLFRGRAGSPSRPRAPRRGSCCLPFFACSLLLAPCSLLSQPAPLDLQLAREPASVTTKAKREFSGLLDGFRDGRLFIRVATGGGEVGYSFVPAEIEKLTLPGADLEAQATELWDRGAAPEALALLEALGRQRLRYLPVLTDAQRQPLWQLIRASMRAGNPLATISYVNQLRPIAQSANDRALLRDADARALLRDAELDAHVKLGHADEIRRLAAAWCAEADPAGGSALGWKILAQLAYDAGDFPQARWTALQPVVFSAHLPMEHLDTCYALAISAADRLNDSVHGTALFREMQARHLAWPATPALAAIGRHYSDLTAQLPAPATAPDEPKPETPSAVAPAPAPDPDRPLENVRKLAPQAPAR